MKIFIKMALVCVCFSVSAQQTKIDSLKLILAEKSSKEEKLVVIDSLNKLLISQSQMEKSIPYFFEMASLSKSLKNHELESKAYLYLSEGYRKKMDSINAKKFALESIKLNIGQEKRTEIYLKGINQLGRVYHHFQYYREAIKTYKLGIEALNDSSSSKPFVVMSNIYLNLSSAYNKIGQNDDSFDAILKGIEIAEIHNKPNDVCYNYYILGYNYMELENYSKAEKYFLKSLTYKDKVSLRTYITMNYHGLGINYSRWGKYTKAIKYNELALKLCREEENKLYEFDVLNNMAVVYSRMNKSKKSVEYGKKALKVAVEINYKLAISGAKLTIVEAYLNLNQFKTAEKYLLEIAKDTIDPKVISKESKSAIYSYFSEIYKSQKKYKNGLEFHEKYKELNDSIQKEKLDSKFLELENKYFAEKKDKEIAIKNEQLKVKELDIERKDKQRGQLISAFGFASLLAIFLGYLLYKRKRQQKRDKIKLIREEKRGTQLEKMVQRIQNQPNQVDGIHDEKFHRFIIEEVNINEGILEVFLYLLQEKTRKEIGEKLHLSSDGVKSRVSKLHQALKIYSKKDFDRKIEKGDRLEIFNDLRLNFIADK